jgi:hypothetical protein
MFYKVKAPLDARLTSLEGTQQTWGDVPFMHF